MVKVSISGKPHINYQGYVLQRKKKKNVLLFIEHDQDMIIELKKNSAPMNEWHVIYALEITDANRQFQAYTKGEQIIENLIVRTHGSGGALVLDENIEVLEEGTEFEEINSNPIAIGGTDIVNYNHPNGNGTKEKLIKDELWSVEKYEALESLIELKKGMIVNGTVVFSACNIAVDNRIGKIAVHFEHVNVLINCGLGAISAIGTFTNTLVNKKTGEITEKKQRIEHVLIVPGSLASKKTRHKGFIFFPMGGGKPEKKGEVILQDDIDTPLLIK